MMRSARLALLALLPAVALTLYLEGQRYDPALLRFQPADAGTNRNAAALPETVDGFHRTAPLRVYGRENLYEYVNGHAEYFLAAGFVTVTVGEYRASGAPDDPPELVVDLYEMGTALQAFGILAEEAGEEPEEIQVGAMGFQADLVLGFIKGRYYVKITSFKPGLPLKGFAGQLAGQLAVPADPLAILSRLPDLGEVAATRFIKEAYRGLGFANNVLERTYRVRGTEIQLFLIAGSAQESRRLADTFLRFFRRSGIACKPVTIQGQTIYAIQDPYEGEWFLRPAPQGVYGLFGPAGPALLAEFVSRTDG